MMIQEQVYKAGIYCRLSSDDGVAGDSSSIQTQKMMLEKYCQEQGFIIGEVYTDDGYSGLNFNRPSFLKMIKDIELGLINLVITKDQSRLGRDYVMTGHYMDIFFPSNNVRYIALNDGIDSIKDNNDIAPFRNILNDMFSKDLSKKVKTAKRQRAHQGYFISSQTPFGYIQDPNNKNKLVIDKEAADIVKYLFELALKGLGSVAIAKRLTLERVITPSYYKYKNGDARFERFNKRGDGWEYKWCYTTIRTILKDMVYVGDMENRKYEVQNYKTKKRVRVPQDKHIIVSNTHDGIISRTDYEKVQQLISARNTPPRHNHENLFRGVLFCKDCGYRMTLAVVKRRNDKIDVMYKCMNHYAHPFDCKHYNSISYDRLKDIITTRIKSFFDVLYDDERLLEIVQSKTKEDNQNLKYIQEKEKIEKRLYSLTKITKKLYEDYANERIDDTTYQTLLKDYQSEQKGLNTRLQELSKYTSKNIDYLNNLNLLKAEIREHLNFTELSPELVIKLIDKIEVEHIKKEDGKKTQEVNIVWRFNKHSINKNKISAIIY